MEKNEILEAVKEGINPLKEGLAKDVKAVSDAVKDIGDRVAKIEALPIGKLFNINHIPSQYKGYKLSNQLKSFRGRKDLEVFGNDEKADEYCKWLINFIKAKKGDMQAMADLKEFYTKANMTEGTGANGGYLVPDEFLWDMVMLGRDQTFALKECTVLNMNTDQLYLPSELTLASVAWTTPESGTISAGEPTFAQVDLDAKRLDGLATVTNELLMDSAMDVVGILSEQFGYAVALELDNQVLSGTGTPISGLTTAACGYSVVFATTSTNFSALIADDFSTAIYKLAQGDLVNARFVINRIGLHYARTLKDSQSRPIFADLGGLVPNTLYGYPYIVSSKITNTSAVSTALAVFGNWKKMIIGRRLGGTTLDVDPYGLFTTYMTRFRIATRWALAVGRSTAFVRIMTAAS